MYKSKAEKDIAPEMHHILCIITLAACQNPSPPSRMKSPFLPILQSFAPSHSGTGVVK